jgi:hypothetical protein
MKGRQVMDRWKNLWKGIAIAGMWVSVSIISFSAAREIGLIALLAAVVTVIVAIARK